MEELLVDGPGADLSPVEVQVDGKDTKLTPFKTLISKWVKRTQNKFLSRPHFERFF